MVKFKDISRPLSVFQVLFKAILIFKDFLRLSCLFKDFSSLCEPCNHVQLSNRDRDLRFGLSLHLHPYIVCESVTALKALAWLSVCSSKSRLLTNA